MNRHVNAISGRLSLRPPQRDSLEILAGVVDILPPDRERVPAEALAIIESEFPTVTDFERDFPSLCFALATGVGKTRLMGAFVVYLHLAKGVRHFFVLAPNLTIYNKLIADFTPGTPKYVLEGIGEFAANPPEIITGDNYESGRGVRRASLFGEDGVHINIFNISKIDSEVRGGAAPRIKRLSEYIGESYFDYLAGLDDLFLIMDESHRYRATSGIRAINELKPTLGLELTATPYTESARGVQPFKNVIYSYPFSQALSDGFVKEPAVATRENFNPHDYTEAQLELLKLEDGVRVHESAKVELEVYARQNDRPVVKPFMLVVAQDTAHADALVATIKDDSFFGGQYRERVITVHSNQKGEERDETVQRLLGVEKPGEPTEIVVHVNMLKEGWDVTNLYTLVPLRTASARTLVEQSIGRGLRLPYGRRVGVPAVDRLTIVAHDRFEAIINEANQPDSLIRTGVVIGRDIPIARKEMVVAPPVIDEVVTGSEGRTSIPFSTKGEQSAARAVLQVVRQFEYLPQSADLRSPEIQAKIVREVAEARQDEESLLSGLEEPLDYAAIVAETAAPEQLCRGEAREGAGFPRASALSDIRRALFCGFRCCLYPLQKFDSDPERRFAVLLEDEPGDLKWLRPMPEHIRILYHQDRNYEPDFVVEAASDKLIVEVKRASEQDDPEMIDKARAAITWRRHATEHAQLNGGKPWSYLLIPQDAITANRTLASLRAQFTVR